MDARCLRIGAGSLLVLLAGGCLTPAPRSSPTTNGDPSPADRPQPEPPQVVETPADAPAETVKDEVTSGVIRYIQRVDDAQALADRRKLTEAVQVYPAQTVSDEQPADSEPLSPPAVRVIPEDSPTTQPAPAKPAVEPTPPAPPEPEPTREPQPEQQPHAGRLPQSEPDNSPPVENVTIRPAKPAELEPPTLEAVTIRAVRDVEPTATPESPQPGVNESAVADLPGPASLRALLERAPLPEDASFSDQLDRRLLWVVVGDYDRAREPLQFVTDDQQQVANRFIEAWIALRERAGGDFSSGATLASARLGELQQALRSVSDLSLPTVAICSAVRGYGQYDAIDPARFAAGDAVEFVLYVEIRNFVTRQQDDGRYESRFDMTTAILDTTGHTVLELPDDNIVDHCRARRTDCFIPRLVRLPTSLSPGTYVAKVTIVDKLGEKVAEGRTAFEVAGR